MTQSISICLIASGLIAQAQTPTTLANFSLAAAGPTSIIQGSDGNFYGTAGKETSPSTGVIYQMTPDGTLTTLFSAANFDPVALVQGSDGNLYGAAPYTGTGASHVGVIFKMTLAGALTVLYNFTGSDGANPTPGLIIALDGNFYGTTQQGGSSLTSKSSGFGTVFKMSPSGALTTLHSFSDTEGATPAAGLIQASDGNFYGVTGLGGNGGCQVGNPITGCGTAYKITAAGALTTLYNFPPEVESQNRFSPNPGPVIQAADGNLFGTVLVGGSTGNGTVYELSLGLPPLIVAPVIAPDGVVNGASFQSGIAPGAWFTISGTNLSSKTDTWNNSIVNGALPTTLDGVGVMVGNQPAYIAYVSPTQINALAPGVPAGSLPMAVTNSSGTSQSVMVQVAAAQPAFFQWGNYAVATRQDFSLAVKNGTFSGTTTVAAKPGDVIILWGTGFGPTSPATPAGMETPSSATYNTATAVSVTVGNKPATVYGAALTPGYAGLYQIAIQIPASLSDGDYPVIATISGAQSPINTMITVQQ